MRDRITGAIKPDQIESEDQARREQVRIGPGYAFHRFNRLVIAAREVIDNAEITQGFRGAGPGLARTSFRPTPRHAVVELLDHAGLLPAIVFIFSRAGCQGAVSQCLTAGLRLTTPAQ